VGGVSTSPDQFRPGLAASWASLAADLGVPDGMVGIRDGLLTSWAEPHRAYHDVRHLWRVLQHVDELAGHAMDLAAVRLAAWYHDAVHDGGADDEERSARRAEHELHAAGIDPDLVAEVARLVRLTVSHHPAPGDRNGEVLCDADLAILADHEGGYRQYVAAVRAEYAHVPDDAFRAGRADVLHALLALPSLFRTPHGRERWESRARANLSAELAELTS
jgi:predicted metal-dependent HD superfamily phosphohydrolase